MSKKKTVQKNDPWAPAQPYILKGLENSGRVFDTTQPQLEEYAGMQRDTYGRLAPGAEAGIQAAQGGVNAWASGSRSGMNPGAATYARMQAANDPSMGLLAGMTGQRSVGDYSGFGGTNPAFARTSALGDGGFVGQGDAANYFRDVMGGRSNEAFGEVLSNTLDDVSTRVNSRFGASGVGFGTSTDHAGILARELGRTSAELRNANFEADQARRLQAAGLLDNGTRADRSQQLSALGMAGDMYNSSEGMRLNALQAGDQARNAEFAQRLQATGLLGDAWARQQGLQMQGAQAADQQYGADIAREMQAWGTAQDLMRGSQGLLSEAAALPWRGVEALSGNVRQNSAGYGTTTTKQSGGLLGDVAGLGLMGASVAGGLGWKPFG